MTAAIWSAPPDKCSLDFPARTLLRFMHNHHLLQLVGKPAWLTIPGGSHTYVQKILARLPENQLHLSTPVFSISTDEDGTKKILVRTSEDPNIQPEEFDAVILATHSDTALQILKQGSRMGGKACGATEDESRILGAFRWSENIAVLHSDTEVSRIHKLSELQNVKFEFLVSPADAQESLGVELLELFDCVGK